MRARPLFALVASLLTVAALATPASAARGRTHLVKVGPGLTYTPETVDIRVGDTVKWVFLGPEFHSVRGGLDPSKPCKSAWGVDSGPRHNGQTYSYTFTGNPTRRIVQSDHDGQCYQGMIGYVNVGE
ncbi:hypothetical protein AB5J62_07190 [Amycolatopsis sp. cg5]|uniref:cupredoxin domain-containing protein n=1 Tax=Amycolatopsis sp. cg5 TaxID=3238802 RepID=UPI003525BF2B